MADTNFAALTDHQKMVWSRDVWKTARHNSFVMQIAGRGPNAVIQRITELTATEKGTKAVITLVPDLEGDGVMGDAELEGNEEEIKAYDLDINIDQIRNANRSKGRITDQKSVVRFRETSRDVLGYWAADRVDQMAFLTMSGVDYRMRTNGALRPGFGHDGANYTRDTGVAPLGYALYDLEFASNVTAPSAKRYFRWDGTNKVLAAGATTSVAAADTPSYAMLVEAKAYAKQRRLKSVRAGGGVELYHVFLHPKAMAKLKLDPDFLANIRNAGVRGSSNPLFSGSVVTVDGLVLHENIHVFNTLGATAGTVTEAGRPGYKWGANATVDGCRILICGAQALAFADIGVPTWEEEKFDYKNKQGISTQKIVGFRKPVFYSPQDGTEEDFGLIAIDVAI